jgi:F0F1-type ATP synthase assembly protein I
MPNKDSMQSKEVWWLAPVQMFLRISGWVALPLILSLFLGKWLDRKYDSAPWLLIATSAIAFITSMYGIIRNAKQEFKKIEEENKDKKQS